MSGGLQALRLESSHTMPVPQEKLRLASVCYQSQQLLTLWSDGTLQCHDAKPHSKALRLRISQKLPAYNCATSQKTNEAAVESPVPTKALSKSITKAVKARKRRQPEADSVELEEPEAASVGVIPLGQHTVAAVRQVTDLPTNGHAASAVELIVTDSSYGCIQSVTGVKLPRAQADAKLQLTPGALFQQHTGTGELVLLYGNAVWLFTIPVSHGSYCTSLWFWQGSLSCTMLSPSC